MIQTQTFRIPPGRYVRQALSIWLGRWWWVFALPLVAMIVAGCYDYRYYFLILMSVFIIYPSLLILIYFNYALRPQAAFATIPHHISITDEYIETVYEEDEERRTPQPSRINIADIAAVEDAGNAMIIHLKSSDYDFIEIPADAFSGQDLKKALQLLMI